MTLDQDAAPVTTGSEEAEAVLAEIRETHFEEIKAHLRSIRQEPDDEAPALEIRLPADLADIDHRFDALNDAEYEAHDEMAKALAGVLQDAAERRMQINRDKQKLLDATLRRLAVTEELLRRERATNLKLRDQMDAFSTLIQGNLTGMHEAMDIAAVEHYATADYERTYREQYEHEPEPQKDGGLDNGIAVALMRDPPRQRIEIVTYGHGGPDTSNFAGEEDLPAFLRRALGRDDIFNEADVWAEPETPETLIQRGFRNLRTILDAMRNPFGHANPSRRIA